MHVYNTLTKKKEELKPLKEGHISMYSCGPTVYNYAHIGNFRNYIFVDQLKRYLQFKGLKVKHVMNITDIDDKTIRDSAKENLDLKKFTEKYTKLFLDDIKALNIKPADELPRATDFVKEMVDFVQTLVDKGFAYEADGSVYFKISKFDQYAKLSGVDLSGQKAGARVDVDEYEKQDPGDFVLLKKSTEDEIKRGITYDSPWGKVRPGWHIECSVMSTKTLGDTFDIHTGGIDLVFPHHENEIAQSECCTGKKFVNYWMHNEHLVVDGKKMAKSAGNFYTLKDLLDKDADPIAVRYLLLSTHYRTKLNFTLEALDAAKNSVERINNFVFQLSHASSDEDIPNIDELLTETKEAFILKMDDDLNISEALSVLFDFIRDMNKLHLSEADAKKALTLLEDLDQVLGIMNFKKEEKIPKEVTELLEQREQARIDKNFQEADSLRDQIQDKGYIIEDSDQGPRLKKA